MSRRTDFARPIVLGRDRLLRELAAIGPEVTCRRDLDLLMTEAFVVDLDELSAVIAEASAMETRDRPTPDAPPTAELRPRLLRRRA